MEVISSIYNSGYNIKKFYLGSRELNLAYLGNQVIYDEVIGDNDLNYILYEFYGSDTLPNTVEAPVKSAILKGNTGYRDIDTGEFLETFEEGRNLEFVSVKMPVLMTTGKNLCGELEQGAVSSSGGTLTASNTRLRTTNFITLPPGTYKVSINSSFDWVYRMFDVNGKFLSAPSAWNSAIPTITETRKIKIVIKRKDNLSLSPTDSVEIQLEQGSTVTPYEPYKTNILTVNEDVTLRSNGDICDELNLLTGQLTQRIGEDGVVLSQEVVKTVDLTIVDQDGKTINKLNSFNGTTYVSTEVAENSTYPMVSLEVASELQAAMSKVAEDIELIKPVQNDIETTIDTQSNDIDSLLLATTELFEMFL